jgi:hypothetical protein
VIITSTGDVISNFDGITSPYVFLNQFIFGALRGREGGCGAFLNKLIFVFMVPR